MTRARDVANLIGSGNYSSTTFTATAGQTAFTISHTQGFIQVFMNGLLLDETVDYTSNGSAVTLTSGAAAGDEIEVVAYNTFSVGDALPKSGGTMSGDLTISTTAGQLKLTDTDGTEQNTTIKQSGGNLFIQARDNTNNAGIVFAGNGGGNYDEHMRINSSGKVGIGTNNPAKILDITESASADTGQVKLTYAGGDGNRAGFILNNTHTGGREYGIYAGNNSTGGGLGSSLGISDNTASTAYRLLIDSSGRVTMPSQPGFVLQGNYNGWTVLNQSGSWLPFTGSTGVGTSANNEIAMNWRSNNYGGYNPTGNGINVSTGVYTAPVTGTYMFTFQSYVLKNSSSSGDYYHINSHINGNNQLDYTIYGYGMGSSSYSAPEITKVVRLSANDTFDFRIYLNQSASFWMFTYYTCYTGYLLG